MSANVRAGRGYDIARLRHGQMNTKSREAVTMRLGWHHGWQKRRPGSEKPGLTWSRLSESNR
jgi:hypothetical protein